MAPEAAKGGHPTSQGDELVGWPMWESASVLSGHGGR
jgi:hypothetical protein